MRRAAATACGVPLQINVPACPSSPSSPLAALLRPCGVALQVLATTRLALKGLCADLKWQDVTARDVTSLAPGGPGSSGGGGPSSRPISVTLPLALVARVAQMLPVASKGASATPPTAWHPVFEDMLRWAVLPLATTAAAPAVAATWERPAAGGGGGAGRAARAAAGPPADPLADTDVTVLVPLLLGMGGYLTELGSDAPEVSTMVERLPVRVRVDLLAGLLPVGGGCADARESLHRTLRRLNAVLDAWVTLGDVGAQRAAKACGGTNVIYPPPLLAHVWGRMREVPEAGVVSPWPMPVPPPPVPGQPPRDETPAAALLSFGNPVVTQAASFVCGALTESLLRATAAGDADLYGTAPGLARLYLTTVALPRGASPPDPCLRGVARPAAVLWSGVLATRLLEVLGESLARVPSSQARAEVLRQVARNGDVATALQVGGWVWGGRARWRHLHLPCRPYVPPQRLFGSSVARPLDLPPALGPAFFLTAVRDSVVQQVGMGGEKGFEGRAAPAAASLCAHPLPSTLLQWLLKNPAHLLELQIPIGWQVPATADPDAPPQSTPGAAQAAPTAAGGMLPQRTFTRMQFQVRLLRHCD